MPTKAIAAGGATAVAGAITTLIINGFWHTADPATASALTTIIAAVLSTLATYFTPHNP